MAKKSMIAKNKTPSESSLLKHTLAVNVVDVHTQFTASLNFAVFASVNWHTKVKSQVSQKHLGNLRYQGR